MAKLTPNNVFRGIHQEFNKMVYGGLLDRGNEVCIINNEKYKFREYPIKENTISIKIGVDDKNNCPYFSGDIAEFPNGDQFKINYSIKKGVWFEKTNQHQDKERKINCETIKEAKTIKNIWNAENLFG